MYFTLLCLLRQINRHEKRQYSVNVFFTSLLLLPVDYTITGFTPIFLFYYQIPNKSASCLLTIPVTSK